MNVELRFREVLQNREDVGTDEDHMVSTVTMDIEAGDRVWRSLTSNIRQTVGAVREAQLIEVELPVGYDGPMNYEAFRDCVATFYTTRIVNIGAGFAGSIVMRNNRFRVSGECSFTA